MIEPSDPAWPLEWDLGCELCGERRPTSQRYCDDCADSICPHCGVVHDHTPCTPIPDNQGEPT